MDHTDRLIPLPAGAANHPVPAAASDDFDTRWAAWLERGRVHELRVRRAFVVWAGVLAMAAATLYALLR